MFAVDANVLVHAAMPGSPWHAPCRDAVERWREQVTPWYATWSVAYEFVRVVTHPRVSERPWTSARAWSFVEALLAAPAFGMLEHTGRHGAVAASVFRELPQLRGSILHDAHIAILMREHGIKRIYTRDADFHRFPFLEVVDPALPSGSPGVAEHPEAYGVLRRGATASRGRHRRP